METPALSDLLVVVGGPWRGQGPRLGLFPSQALALMKGFIYLAKHKQILASSALL